MQARIFFIHSGKESFVEIDRELLIISFDVQDFYAMHKFPANFIKYWKGITKNDIVFCWFASWNSFWALLFSKILRKPSVLVIGGYDVANLPEANYGHQRGGLGKWISRFAMKLATVIFTNSYYSQKEAQQNAGVSGQRLQVIYHGVPNPYGILPVFPKERMALTVGKVDWPNLKRKGLEPFVRAAVCLPDVQFVLVGEWADDSIDYLRSIAPQNLIFTGRVGDVELLSFYSRASVYVQVSLHEGFGLSVAEAMLAGCIPVITKAGSLPEVVGECGIYCESNSPKEMAESIQIALNSSLNERLHVRERIMTKFPIEKRRNLLEQIIQALKAKNTYV